MALVPESDVVNRGISKSIRHFIRHSTILCVTWPSHASLDHLTRHSTILSVTQQFCQDVDFINKFDTIWSSKWLWSIIFFSESGYLDDRTFQHMHVNSKGPQGFVCIWALPIYGFDGLAVVHLSNSAVCICRQVISTLRLEHRWISPKTICLFSNSNHLHLQTGDMHICQSLLFSSLLINWNSFVQPIFTQPFLQSDG